MDTKTNSNKSYVVVMVVSVLCLVIIIFSTTYAYFTPRITGDENPMTFSAGKVKLSISENKITASNLAPILDSTKESKAQKNEFTISRTSDSNLGACYSLYLVVDEIGEKLKNQYFKYELLYGDEVLEGDFSNLTFNEEDGTATIPFLTNQIISDENLSNSYTLRLWLSYDPDNDQSDLLMGDLASRTFKAHIYANGISGKCPDVVESN